jgi:hypothetical protein
MMILVTGLILFMSRGITSAQECPSPQTKRLSQTPIIKDMVNPNLSENDFELPMPCGGRLILRHVCVPSKSYFDDLSLDFGCDSCGRTDRGYMDGKRETSLAGAFTFEDLPDSWRKKLLALAGKGDGRCPRPNAERGQSFYYFIGKYEISTFQWKTIMGNECPGWDVRFSSDDPRPKTNISWFEAVEFTKRYTEWLLKNRPDALPKFDAGRSGYIRIPTEAEWEYAARGGHLVSESDLNRKDFFPLKNKSYADYAVYTGSDAAKPTQKLAWIGTKCANPLGLFDTAGNAAEMMFDPFRFAVADRLHGAAGGFIVKGGSYLKGLREMMPGRREEMPYFIKDGTFRSIDLGFRVVLSGIVNPRNRNAGLKKQWPAFVKENRNPPQDTKSSMPGIELDPNQDMMAEIERLITFTTDREMKRNLVLIKKYINETTGPADEESDTLKSIIWQALFMAESLRTTVPRCRRLQNNLEELKKQKTYALPELEMASLDRKVDDLKEQITTCKEAVDYFAASYLSSVQQSLEYPEDAMRRQFDLITQAPHVEENMRTSLGNQLAAFKKHIDLYRENPRKITDESLIQTIVPRESVE